MVDQAVKVQVAPTFIQPKKIYVASKYENHDFVHKVHEILRMFGHTITYDWTKQSLPSRCSARVGKILHRLWAIKDLEGVESADIVLVILRGGKGTHGELGAALAYGKPVLLVGSPKFNECVYHFHPSVSICRTLKQAIDIINGQPVKKIDIYDIRVRGSLGYHSVE